jgi:hypothetical protein
MKEIWNPRKIARPDVACQIMDKKLMQIQDSMKIIWHHLVPKSLSHPDMIVNVLPPFSSIDIRTVYLIQIYTVRYCSR